MAALRPLLTVAEVAALTPYSQDTILRDVHAGLLKPLRRPKGRLFMFHPDAVEKYFELLAYEPGQDVPKRGSGHATTPTKRRLRLIASGRK